MHTSDRDYWKPPPNNANFAPDFASRIGFSRDQHEDQRELFEIFIEKQQLFLDKHFILNKHLTHSSSHREAAVDAAHHDHAPSICLLFGSISTNRFAFENIYQKVHLLQFKNSFSIIIIFILNFDKAGTRFEMFRKYLDISPHVVTPLCILPINYLGLCRGPAKSLGSTIKGYRGVKLDVVNYTRIDQRSTGVQNLVYEIERFKI